VRSKYKCASAFGPMYLGKVVQGGFGEVTIDSRSADIHTLAKGSCTPQNYGHDTGNLWPVLVARTMAAWICAPWW
jgi:hypothetical protein